LVLDRETGKTKGFGFCEYRDAETALSAMRNLNGYEMNGRPLRVDYAENEKANITGGPGTFQPPQGQPERSNPDWWRNATGGAPIGALPPISRDGANRGGFAPDHIATAVQGMPLPQIYEIMARMKTLVQSNPDHARQTLIANPQLATGLLHAQIMIGMIAPAVVQKIVAHATAKQQAGAQQQPTAQQIGTLVPPIPPTQTTPPPITSYPNTIPSNTTIPVMNIVGAPSTSGVGVVPGGGGVGVASSGEDGSVVGGLGTAEQKALLQQVINLTPQQIEKLPPQQRQQVMQLKQYWMGQGMGYNVPK